MGDVVGSVWAHWLEVGRATTYDQCSITPPPSSCMNRTQIRLFKLLALCVILHKVSDIWKWYAKVQIFLNKSGLDVYSESRVTTVRIPESRDQGQGLSGLRNTSGITTSIAHASVRGFRTITTRNCQRAKDIHHVRSKQLVPGCSDLLGNYKATSDSIICGIIRELNCWFECDSYFCRPVSPGGWDSTLSQAVWAMRLKSRVSNWFRKIKRRRSKWQR